jgi:hypothetical protein
VFRPTTESKLFCSRPEARRNPWRLGADATRLENFEEDL